MPTRASPPFSFSGRLLSGSSASGSLKPCDCRLSASARTTSATTAPRSITPVSRHGAMPFSGCPSHAEEMHSPLTKAVSPSTTIDLRWLRESKPMPLAKPMRLYATTSAPACLSGRKKPLRSCHSEPNQSYTSTTCTPCAHFCSSRSRIRRPKALSEKIYISTSTERSAARTASSQAGKFSRLSFRIFRLQCGYISLPPARRRSCSRMAGAVSLGLGFMVGKCYVAWAA